MIGERDRKIEREGKEKDSVNINKREKEEKKERTIKRKFV